jgi:hypothetical protein
MSEDDRIVEWERVALFLSSEAVGTPEEIRADLEAEGFDVAKSVASLRAMIREEYQGRLRKSAQVGRAATLDAFRATVAEVAAWPMDKLRHWLAEAAAGRFGEEAAGLTLAYRNKEDKEPTEAELRSLVTDIVSSKQ